MSQLRLGYAIRPEVLRKVQYMYCGHITVLREDKIVAIAKSVKQIQAKDMGLHLVIILPHDTCEVCRQEGYDLVILDD